MVHMNMKEIWKIVEDKEKRIHACEENVWLFSLVYFTKYHHFAMPPFHREMYDDLLLKKRGYIWEMFRESAKTTLAKIGIVHKIVYKKKHFITWTSFDQKKAEGNLFDIALELQQNKNLISDFGQLFYENINERKSQKKSIGEFITGNDIKVKSYSVGQSPRGEVYKQYRPDFAILDDIETSKTIVSIPKTEAVIHYIDELMSGLAGYADLLVLANKLTDNGSIAYLKDKIEDNKDWIHRDVPVVKNTRIVWPEKYVATKEERDKINSIIKLDEEKVIALEAKKEELGMSVYNREMLNQPLGDEEREFKWKWLQSTFIQSELDKRLVNRYITIDVADTKEREDRKSKGKPDFTGTICVDWDIENNWYIQLAKRTRMNLPELIDWIFFLWTEYKPVKIGIEKKSLEDQVMPYIRERSEELQVWPVIEELKHGGTAKEDRIRGALQGRFQAGKVHFKKTHNDDTEELIRELYDFPRARFDDLSDGLQYIDQIGARPIIQGSNKVRTAIEQEFFEAREVDRNKMVNRLKNL